MSSTSVFRRGLAETSTSVSVAGLATLTLTVAQTLNRCIKFTGALTANCVVTLPISASPDSGLSWIITNATTNTGGPWTLSVVGPSGNSYSVPQTRRVRLLWDGTNMTPAELGGVLRSDVSIISGITGASPTVTLTSDQANATVISLQGNATGTPVIIVPDGFGVYIINNALGVGVTVKTAGGTGATVATVTNRLIFVDSNGAGNCNLVSG